MPVHPELARVLEAWKGRYALHYGAPAQPGDLLLRNRAGNRLLPNAAWENLLADLETLGLRRRRVHDLRRSMVTLARADGARGELLRWVTHGPNKSSMLDVYTSPTWESLCEQVGCIRVELPRACPVVELRPGLKLA